MEFHIQKHKAFTGVLYADVGNGGADLAAVFPDIGFEIEQPAALFLSFLSGNRGW